MDVRYTKGDDEESDPEADFFGERLELETDEDRIQEHPDCADELEEREEQETLQLAPRRSRSAGDTFPEGTSAAGSTMSAFDRSLLRHDGRSRAGRRGNV